MLVRETLLLSVYYRLLHKDSYTAVSVFIKYCASDTRMRDTCIT